MGSQEDSRREGSSGRGRLDYEVDMRFQEPHMPFFSQVKRLFFLCVFGRKHFHQQGHGTNGATTFDEDSYVGGSVYNGRMPGRGSSHQSSFITNEDSVSRRGSMSHLLAMRPNHHPTKANVISPHNRYYLGWEQLMLLLCFYSCSVTPFEFGFFRRLPGGLAWTDIAINFFFLFDIALTFFVAYKDKKTFTMVEDHKLIALRYLSSTFMIDLLACLPWNEIYKGAGGHGGAEVARWLIWTRVWRAYRIELFFDRIERDIRFNFYVTRIIRLLAVEFFSTHVAGCFFYYLATTIPSENESDTWIGSLVLGGNSYENFRQLDLGKRYVTSLYWAVVTMATLGYGDIHAVNPREMVFIMIFVSFDMVLSAYLIGNITALVVKGGATEKYRERMSTLIQYMNRNRLPQGLRRQMRDHVRLQFETDQVDKDVIEDFPISIQHKVAHAQFGEVVQDCYLFQGCSREFISQIVARGVHEIFMPLEIVFHRRDTGDNMYIVLLGVMEELSSSSNGQEEVVAEVFRGNVVGEVALLCNIPQPFTVRVRELTEVFRIDKQAFNAVIATYLLDGRQLVNNLLERSKETNSKYDSLAVEINSLISQQEAELVMTTINAASRGDIEHLRQLIKAGANPGKADYDGRTALHLAASRGYDDVVRFLISEGCDANCKDNFGVTPLLEALRQGHTTTAKLLQDKGGEVALQEAGTDLCNAVIHGDTGLLQRLLDYGVDPNSADYDLRTPLHIAAAEGFLLVVQLLVNHGADVFARDRWGNVALDEAQRCQSLPVVRVLEGAMVKKLGTGLVPAGDKAAPNRQDPVPAGGSDHQTDTTLALAAAAVADVAQKVKQATDAANDKKTIGEDGDKGKDDPLLSQGVGGIPSPIPESPRSDRSGVQRLRSMDTPGGLTPLRSNLGSPRYSRTPRVKGALAGIMYGADAAKKRATIYPYHPWVKSRKAGRLVFVPATIKELLAMGQQHFKAAFTRVLSPDAGEIPTCDLILDGDRLYLAMDEDPEEEEGKEGIAGPAT